MKKIIVIAIIIAAAIAIFAVVAGQNDIAESVEKAETTVEQKVKPEDMKKNVKLPVKAVKMPTLKIDKEKLRKSIQKSKEEKTDFNQKQKKCILSRFCSGRGCLLSGSLLPRAIGPERVFSCTCFDI